MVDPLLVLALLAAAFMHAAWNALTKGSSDPLLGMTVVSCSGAILAAIAACFLPLPAPESWPYLAAATAVHIVYQLVLVRGYTLGDLSQVYPIARGVAPLIIAVLAAVWAQEIPTPTQALGLVLASGSIISLGYSGHRSASVRDDATAALRTALLTAALIALYTTIDGLGARRAGSPWSYAAWCLFLYAIPIAAVALNQRRGKVLRFVRAEGAKTAVGGAMAVSGYAIVLYAMSQTTMASVASLRETSVVFATFLGTRMLGEPFGGRRIFASVVLVIGLVLVAG